MTQARIIIRTPDGKDPAEWYQTIMDHILPVCLKSKLTIGLPSFNEAICQLFPHFDPGDLITTDDLIAAAQIPTRHLSLTHRIRHAFRIIQYALFPSTAPSGTQGILLGAPRRRYLVTALTVQRLCAMTDADYQAEGLTRQQFATMLNDIYGPGTADTEPLFFVYTLDNA